MKVNYDKLVCARIESQEHFGSFRKTQHTLRRLLAGDLSPLGMTPQQKADDDPKAARPVENWSDYVREQLYDVLVTDVAAGHSNQMWHAIKTLVMQTAYRMPSVEFEDLSTEEAAMNTAYLKTICGPSPRGCDAVDEHRVALMDCMIGGTGAVHMEFRKGRPAVAYSDILDLTWDTSAHLLTKIRWVSRRVRKPIWEWVEMFGEAPFEKYLSDTEQERTADDRIELEWYYDVTGGNGRGKHYVIFPGETSEDGETPLILDQGNNPFYCTIDGFEDPFLPVNFMYFLQVPSVRYPMSLVQMMLPHQIAIWGMERNFNSAVKEGGGSWYYEEGSMSDEEYGKWIRQNKSGVVKLKKGAQPPGYLPGRSIEEKDLAHYQYHDKQLVAQGGANPYAGGSRVDGVAFSSEVASINAAGDLMAGNVSKDHSQHWERTAGMLLKAAVTYDKKPITLRVGEESFTFDENLPIQMFLRPDGDLVVKENSGAFRPRTERINEAMMTLKVAQELNASANGRFTPFVERAAEEFLRAKGEKNIAAWMEAPEPPAMPGMDPSMMDPAMFGGEDQMAEIEARTA
jgi:hypothetical protein